MSNEQKKKSPFSSKKFRHGTFAVLLIAAVIVYAIFVVVLRCITYEDCMLLPKGEKIAKILHIKQKT